MGYTLFMLQEGAEVQKDKKNIQCSQSLELEWRIVTFVLFPDLWKMTLHNRRSREEKLKATNEKAIVGCEQKEARAMLGIGFLLTF